MTNDGMDTEMSTCLTDKWKAKINQDGLYNKKVGAQIKELGKMAKNQSLPARAGSRPRQVRPRPKAPPKNKFFFEKKRPYFP